MAISEPLSCGDSCNVVAEVDVDVLVGRLLRWWWNRLRRTLELVLVIGGLEDDGFEAMVCIELVV